MRSGSGRQAHSVIFTLFELINKKCRNVFFIAGFLPDSWAQAGAMPALKHLSLDVNDLRGSLPGSWGAAGNMPALRLLSMQSNQISGQLPKAWCSEARSFPAIEVAVHSSCVHELRQPQFESHIDTRI